MQNILDAAEHIAAVVKGHDLHIGRYGYAGFQIHNHHGVAADGHRERIHAHQVAVRFAKSSDRNNHLTRACLFITKAAQRRRSAGKEALTDWQKLIEVIKTAVAVLIARRKSFSQPKRQVAGKYSLT